MADAPPPPANPALTLYEIPWLRLFPCLRLFQAAGAASNPKRLLLAGAGLALLHLGWFGLRYILGESTDWVTSLPAVQSRLVPFDFGAVLARLAEPLRTITSPFAALFSTRATGRAFLHAALAAAWSVIVWGLVGGAIARVAAVSVARGERVGLREALRFSARRALPLAGTPAVPLLAVVLVTSLLAVFGLLYRLPGNAGTFVAGSLGFLPLLGGLLLALIVLGLAFGWPLMPPAVAAEDEDAFDAMSRSYAYVHQRPWHYAGYALLAALVGMVGLVVVNLFAELVLYLTAWALDFGAPAEASYRYYSDSGKGPMDVSTPHDFWLGLIYFAVRAWPFSYFWTAATTIYLLLRRQVDGTPFARVNYQAPTGPLVPGEPQAEPPAGGAGEPA